MSGKEVLLDIDLGPELTRKENVGRRYEIDGRGSLAWQDDANCLNSGVPDAFFPDVGRSLAVSRLVCSRCAVRADCLEDALVQGNRLDEFGVLGGMSVAERRSLRAIIGSSPDERSLQAAEEYKRSIWDKAKGLRLVYPTGRREYEQAG